MQVELDPKLQGNKLFSREQQVGLFSKFNFNSQSLVRRSTRSQTVIKMKKAKKAMKAALIADQTQLKSPYNCDSPNFKRQFQERNEDFNYQNSGSKKIKLQPKAQQMDESKINSILDNLGEIFESESNQQFFQVKFFHELTPSNKNIVFPDPVLKGVVQKKNQLLIRKIDIISNQNQKVSIPIHQGLYKTNLNHKPHGEQIDIQDIPNLCDLKTKNQYSKSIQFIRDYKSGYAPIELQRKNEDDEQINEKNVQSSTKDPSKTHFIKKKQSTLNLPRTCGVSYIKASESDQTQKPPFQPLPPLIFQCSSSCSIGATEQTASLKESEKYVISNFIRMMSTSWLPFIITNQSQMRSLLLNKITPDAKAGFVHGIQNLWSLFNEGVFILILVTQKMPTSEKMIWEAFKNNQSCFKIGILAKKSTSGKKTFLKSIKFESDNTSVCSDGSLKKTQFQRQLRHNLEQNYYQSKIKVDINDSPQEQKKTMSSLQELEQDLKNQKNVNTMSLRMEMYVQQNLWKEKYSKVDKLMLNEIITGLKQELEKKSIAIITQRFKIAKQSKQKQSYFNIKLACLRKTVPQNNNIEQVNGLENNSNTSQVVFSQQFLKQLINRKFGEKQRISNQIQKNSLIVSPNQMLNNSEQSWKKSLKMPIYYITTRDSFAFDLIQKKTLHKRGNHYYTKVQYLFYPDNIPANYGNQYRKMFPNLEVGITSYHNFFTDQELKGFEKQVFSMEERAFKNKFLQNTVQPSIVTSKIKRTKFFFGYRYMWTKSQLAQPYSFVGAGVRKDVTPPPQWTHTISNQMEKQNLVEKDFINSIAVNVYHDGKQGLAQHFDDAVRFKQPIYTLRLFSDARLSFGSQFYGFCNGAFIIPLPRGCICVMQENSYAANGVKHCVRPCDMTGKSAAVILRQMHHQVVSESSKFDEYVDFPAWLSCMSDNDKAVTYAEQKRLQTEHIQ